MKDDSNNEGTDLATESSETLRAAQGDGQPCPNCQCDGTIEGRKGRELQQRVFILETALKDLNSFLSATLPPLSLLNDAARAALAAVADSQES